MYKIYHIPGKKIGCTENIKSRMRNQGVKNYEILEEHSCIYTASKRELELQKEYGYKVDTLPYHKFVDKNQKRKGGLKGGLKGGPKNVLKASRAKRKFTFEEATEIRKYYKENDISIAELARKHNVSQPIMYYIIKNKTYLKP